MDLDAQFKQLFMHMREGYCLHEIILGADGKPYDILHLLANPAYGEQIGKAPEEVVGKTVRQLYPDVDPSWIERYSKVALTGEAERFEGRFGPLGRWFDVSAYQTEPGRFALVFSDITERKRREAELDEAKRSAEAAQAAKSAFLANMSHEMRTPLHHISGMMYLLRTETLSDKQSDRADKIELSVRRLTRMVEAILRITELESQESARSEPIDLGTQLNIIAVMLHDHASEKRLELKVLPINLPTLNGDMELIESALLCYLNNAIKFTDSGGVTLGAGIVEDGPEHAVVRFEVTDTGIGIPPEAQKRLFHIFEQVDNSTTRKYGGTGIGLAMVKRLAKIMGGDAGCISTPGQGSTFWFTARMGKQPS